MRKTLLIMCGAMLAGCANVEFTPFEGAVPVGKADKFALVDRRHAVPIYSPAPTKPWVGMGKIETWIQGAQPAYLESTAARKAKSLGADGLIAVNSERDYAGAVGMGQIAAPAYAGAPVQAFGLSQATWIHRREFVPFRWAE